VEKGWGIRSRGLRSGYVRRQEIVQRAAAQWDKLIEGTPTQPTVSETIQQEGGLSQHSPNQPSVAPRSLTEEIKFLQAEQQELQTLSNMALAKVLTDPDAACAALQDALHRTRSWGERMRAWQVRSNAQGISILLFGMGQAAVLSGRLTEAHDVVAQALSLATDTNSKAFGAEVLGQVATMQASLSYAEDRFDEAYKGYVETQQWESAARALGERAQCAYQRGDRLELWRRLDDAIAFATAHSAQHGKRNIGLEAFAARLGLTKLRYQLIADPSDEPIEQLIDHYQRRNTLELDRIEIEELIADYRISRGAISDAIKHLETAAQQAGFGAATQTPEQAVAAGQQLTENSVHVPSWIHKQCTLLQKLSDLYLFSANPPNDDVRKAVEHASESARIARTLNQPILLRPALSSLVRSLCMSNRAEDREGVEQALGELRTLGTSEDLAHALLARAEAQFKERRWDHALQTIAEAEQCAGALANLDLRRIALTARIAVLGAAGSWAKALEANQKALVLFEEQNIPGGELALTSSDDWLNGLHTLSANAALLLARAGRIDEAFDCAESGTARRLRVELAQGGLTEPEGASLKAVCLGELRSIMEAEHAATAIFWPGIRESVILIVKSGREQPEATQASFSVDDLKTLIPPVVAGDDPVWTDQQLDTLSEKLLPAPLREVIQDPHIRVLYLVIDPRLYRVPFAALRLRDGSPIIQHCALAYAPSAAIVTWCLLRTAREPRRKCLVAGIGAENATSFARHAQEIRDLIGTDVVLLPEPEATVQRFWELAPQFDVLHLSCHGELDTLSPSSLIASRLRFNDGSISAKDVLEHKNQLTADLVFLNACRSGLFNVPRSKEMGGFWEAFLRAGVPSTIATLRFVVPEYAQRLALTFYDSWMREGTSKAEALRRAQLTLCKEKVEPRHWASHILVGAHR
jgi:CHAT domain-containing protein